MIRSVTTGNSYGLLSAWRTPSQSKSLTVDNVLQANKGMGPGFDILRIALAVIIFGMHVGWLTGKSDLAGTPLPSGMHGALLLAHGQWTGWMRPFAVSFVPAFFALSGFLVMGSAVRTRATQTFLMFRALRIFPALIVELSLSALVLGLWFTSLPISQYLVDPSFFRYFGNVLGKVDFFLPGVFGHNPVPNIVNRNLWTLPSEFDCYLITALLMVTGFLYRKRSITILFVLITLVFAALNSFSDFSVERLQLAPITITYYFFMGMMLFQWKELIPIKWSLFFFSAAFAYLLQMPHHTVYLAPVFLTYCTIFLGMLKLPRLPIIATGDYSYGIYLYGFPITQAVIATVPYFQHNRPAILVIAGTLTFAFAAFSWHVIEKRALRAKRHLPKTWFPTPKRQPSPAQTDPAVAPGFTN